MKSEGEEGDMANAEKNEALSSQQPIPYLQYINSTFLLQQAQPQSGIGESIPNLISQAGAGVTTIAGPDQTPAFQNAKQENLESLNPFLVSMSNYKLAHHSLQQLQSPRSPRMDENMMMFGESSGSQQLAYSTIQPQIDIQQPNSSEKVRFPLMNNTHEGNITHIGVADPIESKNSLILSRLPWNKISLHLFSILNDTFELRKNIQGQVLCFCVSIIVEVLIALKRDIFEENGLFCWLAAASFILTIVSSIMILIYQGNLQKEVLKCSSYQLRLHFLAQILRTAVFCSSELSYQNPSETESSNSKGSYRITPFEGLIEMFMVCIFTESIIINFLMEGVSHKLKSIESAYIMIAGLSMIKFREEEENISFRDQIISILLGAILIGFFIVQFFQLKYLTISGIFSRIQQNRINSKKEQDELNKRKMFSLQKYLYFNELQKKARETTVQDEQKQLTPVQADGVSQFGQREIDEASQTARYQKMKTVQIRAKKAQTDSSLFGLIDQKMNPIYLSKKLSNEITSVISENERQQSKLNKTPVAVKRENNIVIESSKAAQQLKEKQDSKNRNNKGINSKNSEIDYFRQLLQQIVIEKLDENVTNILRDKKNAALIPASNLKKSYISPLNETNSTGSTGLLKIYGNEQPSSRQSLTNLQKNSQNSLPLILSQVQSYLAPPCATYKDLISARNQSQTNINNKINGASINQTQQKMSGIGFSSRIGLKQKPMIQIKDFLLIFFIFYIKRLKFNEFLTQIQMNQDTFSIFNQSNPIVVAQFSINPEQKYKSNTSMNWMKFQIKLYPLWNSSSFENEIPKNEIKKSEEADNKQANKIEFLVVFEEVKEREKVIYKQQFYKLLKSVFRCFNNDLSRSLGNILLTSQAGIRNGQITEQMKDQFVRPILLSCKVIKYILHNLRDFNDIAGERFALKIHDTSVPKVAEDSVMLFKATSSKKLSFKVVISEEVPILIMTDQRRLMQIIITLLANSYKHTNSGSLVFRIFHPKVGEFSVRNHLRFQVEDTGEGMDVSIQTRLAKLFSSAGIGFQDFKTISNFGFNLFICNIIAKKLFNPITFVNNQYEQPSIDQSLLAEKNSGIKFSSIEGKGSIFYFDIKLQDKNRIIDRKETDLFLEQNQTKGRFQNTGEGVEQITSLPQNDNQTVAIASVDFSMLKPHPNIRNNVFITNSIPQINPSAMLTESEKVTFLKAQTVQKEVASTQILADDVPDEENQEKEIKTMVFQSQPRGIHSDYRFLKCNCKNVLVIDKVASSLDALESALESFMFCVQRCSSINEAITHCISKKQMQCSVCNSTAYVCIIIAVEEFYKADTLNQFPREIESFLSSNNCLNSIVLVISNTDTAQTRQLKDNPHIDDFIPTMFDSVEFFEVIRKWRLLPYLSTDGFNQFTQSHAYEYYGKPQTDSNNE